MSIIIKFNEEKSKNFIFSHIISSNVKVACFGYHKYINHLEVRELILWSKK